MGVCWNRTFPVSLNLGPIRSPVGQSVSRAKHKTSEVEVLQDRSQLVKQAYPPTSCRVAVRRRNMSILTRCTKRYMLEPHATLPPKYCNSPAPSYLRIPSPWIAWLSYEIIATGGPVLGIPAREFHFVGRENSILGPRELPRPVIILGLVLNPISWRQE